MAHSLYAFRRVAGSYILVELFYSEGKTYDRACRLVYATYGKLHEHNDEAARRLRPDDGMAASAMLRMTYLLYDTSKPPDFSRLTLTGAKLTPGTAHVLWASEANGPESSPDYPGSYAKLPVGFAVDIRQTGVSSKSSLPAHFVMVALRGTQTWDEWIDDAEAYPAFYGDRPGLVHGRDLRPLYLVG